MAALENLDSAVRIESILDGQDIEPATRLEYFLKKAAEGGGGGGESGVQELELITQDNAPLPPEGVTPTDYKLSVVDAYDESVVTGDVYCLSGGRPAYIPSFIKGRKGIGPAYVMSGNASPVATDVNKNYGLTIKSEMSVLFISDNSGFIGFGVSKDDLIWGRVKER